MIEPYPNEFESVAVGARAMFVVALPAPEIDVEMEPPQCGLLLLNPA